jgi:hypothetical protein
MPATNGNQLTIDQDYVIFGRWPPPAGEKKEHLGPMAPKPPIQENYDAVLTIDRQTNTSILIAAERRGDNKFEGGIAALEPLPLTPVLIET